MGMWSDWRVANYKPGVIDCLAWLVIRGYTFRGLEATETRGQESGVIARSSNRHREPQRERRARRESGANETPRHGGYASAPPGATKPGRNGPTMQTNSGLPDFIITPYCVHVLFTNLGTWKALHRVIPAHQRAIRLVGQVPRYLHGHSLCSLSNFTCQVQQDNMNMGSDARSQWPVIEPRHRQFAHMSRTPAAFLRQQQTLPIQARRK
jgi:hypothetical protein